MLRKDIIERKEEILQWINENKYKSYICKELKCRPSTLNYWLKKMNIKYKGCSNWARGKKLPKKPIEIYLRYGTTISSDKLKNKIFESGLKEKKCEKCGITHWNNVEAPLELHHIDGDRHNNEMSNLQILCPNCHAQTINFCRTKTQKKKYYCKCGNEKNRLSNCCEDCNKVNKRKVKNRPSKEELVKMIVDTSLEAVGRKYGVTGNAVKKWIK